MRTALTLALACAALGGVCSSASAGTTLDFFVNLDDGVSKPAPGGSVGIDRLNTGLSTRFQVVTGVGPDYDVTNVAGPDNLSSGTITGLAAGDTVVIRQPSGNPIPIESYVIPGPTIDPVVGATQLTGTIPAGLTGYVEGDSRCELNSPSYPVGTGAYSVPYTKVLPGEVVSVISYSPTGDRTMQIRHAPGETPCIEVDGSTRTSQPPGAPPTTNPFNIRVDHLISSDSASTRTVLRRGSSILADESEDSTSTYKAFPEQPQPGDIVDVYRPKTAPTPKFSIVLPAVTAIFDPTVDLIAVNAPASGLLLGFPCHHFTCSTENFRSVRGAPAGRTIFDFTKVQSISEPIDIRPDDIVNVGYYDPDFTLYFAQPAKSGDLVAPVQSFKLPTKLKLSAILKALGKGLKIKLKSNEAGTAKLTFGKLATAKGPVKAGTTTMKFKFTKAGKKQIKKLAAKGKKAKPLSVSLTSVVTDASGNASTVVKKTKIKP
jgi:hypothetical protein